MRHTLLGMALLAICVGCGGGGALPAGEWASVADGGSDPAGGDESGDADLDPPPADPGPGDACVAHCYNRNCGDDGCGGVCGTCQPGLACQDGRCAKPPCGSVEPEVQGSIWVAYHEKPVYFPRAAAQIRYHRGNDEVTGGAIAEVDLQFWTDDICAMTLHAKGGRLGLLPIDEVYVAVSDVCTGDTFGSVLQELVDGPGLTLATLAVDPPRVPDGNAATSCLDGTLTVRLEGALHNTSATSPRDVKIRPAEFHITGRFRATGFAGVAPPACAPDCSGKVCGTDGCGGSCGSCCCALAECVEGSCACTGDCTGRECGSDGCEGSCGRCGAGQTCNIEGRCEACVEDPAGSCKAYFACTNLCAEGQVGEGCEPVCRDRLSTRGRDDFDAYQDCARDRCPEYVSATAYGECLSSLCKAEQAICLHGCGTATCAALLACRRACESPPIGLDPDDCQIACFFDATSDAQVDYQDFTSCLIRECPACGHRYGFASPPSECPPCWEVAKAGACAGQWARCSQ